MSEFDAVDGGTRELARGPTAQPTPRDSSRVQVNELGGGWSAQWLVATLAAHPIRTVLDRVEGLALG